MTARIITLILLVGCIIAIPLSHSAMSQKKKAHPEKTPICHFPEDSEGVGHVIVVSKHAVDAHISKHGDCTDFLARPNGACRCLTCEELCQRDARICRAQCDPNDVDCLNACTEEFDTCIAECNPDAGGG